MFFPTWLNRYPSQFMLYHNVHSIDAFGNRVTEVGLPFTTPSVGLDRLQRHLPSSSYTYAALYTLRSARKASCRSQGVNFMGIDHISDENLQLKPASLILLKSDFQWRFGGTREQEASPPWIWRSEQLCGQTYCARDMSRFLAACRPTITAPCKLTKCHTISCAQVGSYGFIADF